MLIKFHKLVATVIGVGYIGKGGGSVVAALYCIIYYWLGNQIILGFVSIPLTLFVIILGVWSSNNLAGLWGEDNKNIVIDEVAGMQISLLFIPPSLFNIVCAFVLFRFFDIVKPLYIKKTEKLPKGWGVMFDDVLAGLYSNIILQIIIITVSKYAYAY